MHMFATFIWNVEHSDELAEYACKCCLLQVEVSVRPRGASHWSRALPGSLSLLDMSAAEMLEDLARELMRHNKRFREENEELKTKLQAEQARARELVRHSKRIEEENEELKTKLQAEQDLARELQARAAPKLVVLKPRVAKDVKVTAPRGSLASCVGLKAKARPSKPSRAVDIADL